MLKKLTSLLGVAAERQEENRERIEVAVAVVLLEDLLQERFALDAAAAGELLTLAEQVRADSFDLQQFTSQINQNFDREEKLAVMETLWRIIYADGVLDKYEDALARQLASLLRLSHREVIDLKLKVLDEQRSSD